MAQRILDSESLCWSVPWLQGVLLELVPATPEYSPDRAPGSAAPLHAEPASPPIPHQSRRVQSLVAQPMTRRSVYLSRSLAVGDHGLYTTRDRCPLAHLLPPRRWHIGRHAPHQIFPA